MASEDTEKLCYRWIVEYDCWRMWTTFSQLGSVDGIPNRVGATYDQQNNQNAWNSGDCKTDGFRLLVCFMCKISDAANEVSATAQHDATPRHTILEEAIDLLHHLFRCFSKVLEPGDQRDVQLCLKQHAVLAPLRKNDQTTAKVTRLTSSQRIFIGRGYGYA